ncbi:LuxR C-terminal-related transcriptional regulator [Mumia sp. zg.B53]|uniref:LuxR C-terminal-related transcriptional regulator n=1 Tax=Mumia sp. zg.B53 TaxID=2855449 RepID=UPI001C6EB698|nr:LuxR C-terminal-related transcriptional regulator [Mumia sp. zg.B53]MBW9215708.1 LuxR C-terminal-related transcriptional regulator [Mumia sp. zg.B53]
MALEAHQQVFVDEGVIVRRRLLATLDRATRRPVTLVAAPTGYGKTTLLRQWADEHAPDAAWLDGSGTRPWETATRELHRGRPVVIDDAHLAGWGPSFTRACEAARVAAPLVLVARLDPLVALHPARLAGRVSEVRAGELAFTVGEVARVASRSGRRLDHEQAQALHDQTDGWPAGVRLCATQDPVAPTPTGAYSPTGSYLLAHVLDTLDPSLVDFLRTTAVPVRFDTDLAARLSGREDAAAVLDEVTHRVGFVSVDGETGLFRYHQLLRQLLLSEVERQSPGRLPGLHDVAARWSAARGDARAAAAHALHARSWDIAVDCAVALACTALGDGDWTSCDQVIDAVPEVEVLADDRLRVLAAVQALRADDVLLSRQKLGEGRGAVGRSITSERLEVLRRLCLARLALIDGHVTDAAAALGSPQPRLSEGGSSPHSPAAALQATWASTYGLLMTLRGDTGGAAGHLATARHVSRGELSLSEAREAEVRMWSAVGRGDPAAADASIALLRAAADDTVPGATAVVDEWLAMERGGATVPTHHDAPSSHQPLGLLPARFLEAFRRTVASRAAGGPPPRDVLLGQLPDESTWLVARHTALAGVTRLLAQGDAAAATAAVDRAAEHCSVLDRTPYDLWIAATSVLQRRHREAAPEELEAILDDETAVPEDLAVRIAATAAVIELAQGPSARGTAFFRRALVSTERHGWRRPWRELGTSAIEMLTAERARRGTNGPLVARLLVELRDERPRNSLGLVVALSSREDEILQYLPTAMDQSDLCEALFISRNTLKTHLRAIYHKLGVESRREAVLKAQESGLL